MLFSLLTQNLSPQEIKQILRHQIKICCWGWMHGPPVACAWSGHPQASGDPGIVRRFMGHQFNLISQRRVPTRKLILQQGPCSVARFLHLKNKTGPFLSNIPVTRKQLFSTLSNRICSFLRYTTHQSLRLDSRSRSRFDSRSKCLILRITAKHI